MNEGFTLVELLIVIIIISVLASVGFVQYGNMVERGRGAEANYIFQRIRDAEEMYIVENDDVQLNVNLLDIGTIPDAACSRTHYFRYGLAGNTDAYVILATRCTEGDGDGGKPPSAAAGYTIRLDIDRITGSAEMTDGS